MTRKLLCVYCSSSADLDPKYTAMAEAVGHGLVARGWGLIYGGGCRGLMGAVARAVHKSGGHVVGVIPEFMKAREWAYLEADELVTVTTMRERKGIMEERATAFLTLPGGIGTMEEMAEIIVLRSLDVIDKPLVLLNQDGYYDDFIRFLARMAAENFIPGVTAGSLRWRPPWTKSGSSSAPPRMHEPAAMSSSSELPLFHVVGFSGHRLLADPMGVSKAIHGALRALQAEAPGEWLALSSVAEGGDQLFVAQAQSLGLSWQAILPLPRAEFATDFSPSEWTAVENLLGSAEHVRVITENGTREEAYLDCGLRRSTVPTSSSPFGTESRRAARAAPPTWSNTQCRSASRYRDRCEHPGGPPRELREPRAGRLRAGEPEPAAGGTAFRGGKPLQGPGVRLRLPAKVRPCGEPWGTAIPETDRPDRGAPCGRHAGRLGCARLRPALPCNSDG